MATARVVVEASDGQTPAVGNLFAGLRFFLLQRVPQRNTFIDSIKANGGSVVRLEEQADHVIADHLRADAPAGSLSYTFLEKAIRDGQLPDVEDHRAARKFGTARPVGSSIRGKSTRTLFTPEDDRVLYEWVEPCRRAGGPVQGNEIYKQLEQINPRHTFQAWRDRYIKKLMDRPPPANAEIAPTPPTIPPSSITKVKSTRTPFTPEDDDVLYNWVEHCRSRGARVQGNEIYKLLEQENSRHTWQAWRDRYVKKIMDRPSPGHVEIRVPANPPPSPPVEPDQVAIREPNIVEEENVMEEPDFTEEELTVLLGNAEDIEDLIPENVEDAWNHFSTRFPHHSAASWCEYYETVVRPVYLEQLRQERKDRAKSGSAEDDEQDQPDPVMDQPEQREQRRFMVPRGLNDNSRPTESTKRKLSESNPSEHRQKRRKSVSPISAHVYGGGRPIDPAQNRTLQTSTSNSKADSEAANVPDLHTEQRREQHEQQLQRVPTHSVTSSKTSVSLNIPKQIVESSPHNNHGSVVEKPDPELIRKRGDALTEANLASQESQHWQLLHGNNGPQDGGTVYQHDIIEAEYHEDLHRGTDLPKDRDTASQTDFIETLQNMIPKSRRKDERFSLLSQRATEAIEQQRKADDAESHDSQHAPSREHSSDPQSPSIAVVMDDQARREEIESQPLGSREDDNSLFGQSIEQTDTDQHDEVEDDQSNLAAGSGFHFMGHIEPFTIVRAQSTPSQHQQEDHAEIETDRQTERVDLEQDEIDLTVAEPEGGFLRSSSRVQESSLPERPSNLSAMIVQAPLTTNIPVEEDGLSSPNSDLFVPQDTSRRHSARVNIRALETQDILDAETQQPDLDIPSPPSFSQDSPVDLFSQEQLSPDSGEPTSGQHNFPESQPMADEDVETYVQTMRLRGFVDADIIHALKCTSMYPDLTELVLLEQKAGRGIPVDISGVWSEEEDLALEGGDPDALRRLEAKHSWDGCETRMKFLEAWREEDDD